MQSLDPQTGMQTGMPAKTLCDDALHRGTLEAAKREKKATYELLEFLHEIDQRRLYAVLGYSSLYMYVKTYLGYGDHQAFDRVAAMRLIFRIDEVKTALQAGKLNLSTAAQLSVHVRKQNLNKIQTLELLPRIENRSKREIEAILTPNKLKTVALEIDDECEAFFERFRQLEGNPGLSLSDCVKLALHRCIVAKEKRNRVLRAPGLQKNKAQSLGPDVNPARMQTHKPAHDPGHNPTRNSSHKPSMTPAINSAPDPAIIKIKESNESLPPGEVLRPPSTRYVPKEARENITRRADNRCEYVHSQTGRRCNGKHGLQFDHIKPYALGGETTEENLQLLCAAHNRLRAIQTFGTSTTRHMKRRINNGYGLDG